MTAIRKAGAAVAGGVLCAVAAWLLMALPGLVSDAASTVPVHVMARQVRR